VSDEIQTFRSNGCVVFFEHSFNLVTWYCESGQVRYRLLPRAIKNKMRISIDLKLSQLLVEY
jgi:hypothetical protein